MDTAILILNLVVIGTVVYVARYLKQKAQNLATKEDVGAITTIVEQIKRNHADEMASMAHTRQLEINRLDLLNNLRLASIDERLKAYQEAYSLIFRMLSVVGDRERSVDVLIECTTFWETRSLYISESARDALDKAMIALNSYSDERPQNRKIITNALRVIEQCVSLPEFSGEAERQVEERSEPTHQARRAKAPPYVKR